MNELKKNRLLRVKLDNAQKLYNECKDWNYTLYTKAMRDLGGFSAWERKQLIT